VGSRILAESFSCLSAFRAGRDPKGCQQGQEVQETTRLTVETIQDFEDMLSLLNKHEVRYLIVGGLAFIYHAKPRYTKDIDLWIDPSVENQQRVNTALAEFGSPVLLATGSFEEILQIGMEPDRIDIMQKLEGVSFTTAWRNRITDEYGDTKANWISIDDLILAKEGIDHPRHQEDVRVLREVKRLRGQSE
jgi:hypothetical protein